MDNFNKEAYKKTVLLYSAAGLSYSDVDGNKTASELKTVYEQIAEYFNKEDNPWYENLKMQVVAITSTNWGFVIADKNTNCGLKYGSGSYKYLCVSHNLSSEPLWINSASNKSVSVKDLYFTYIKCKNGYICGVKISANDNEQLIRMCGFKGKNISGEDSITLVQNDLKYFVATQNSNSLIVDNAVGQPYVNDEIVLNKFYVPGTDFFVPDVFRCEGSVQPVGDFYKLNGHIYVNCMHHGKSYAYDTCKLAFKVC